MSKKVYQSESYDNRNILSGLPQSKPNPSSLGEVSMIEFSASRRDSRRLTEIIEEDSRISIPQKPLYYPYQDPEYNPSRKPPDLKKAEQYRWAHKIIDIKDLRPITEHEEYSGLPVVRKLPSICTSSEKLGYYGPVLPMFFSFYKIMEFISLIRVSKIYKI